MRGAPRVKTYSKVASFEPCISWGIFWIKSYRLLKQFSCLLTISRHLLIKMI